MGGANPNPPSPVLPIPIRYPDGVVTFWKGEPARVSADTPLVGILPFRSEGAGVVTKGTVFASTGATAGALEMVGAGRGTGWDRQLTRLKAGVSCPCSGSAPGSGAGQRQMGNPG